MASENDNLYRKVFFFKIQYLYNYTGFKLFSKGFE